MARASAGQPAGWVERRMKSDNPDPDRWDLRGSKLFVDFYISVLQGRPRTCIERERKGWGKFVGPGAVGGLRPLPEGNMPFEGVGNGPPPRLSEANTASRFPLEHDLSSSDGWKSVLLNSVSNCPPNSNESGGEDGCSSPRKHRRDRRLSVCPGVPTTDMHSHDMPSPSSCSGCSHNHGQGCPLESGNDLPVEGRMVVGGALLLFLLPLVAAVAGSLLCSATPTASMLGALAGLAIGALLGRWIATHISPSTKENA